MNTAQIISYKGKKIIYVELEGDIEEEISTIEKAKKLFEICTPKSVDTITNVENANYDPKGVKAMKEYSKHNTPFVKNSVVVGVTGMKKIVVWSVSKVTGRDYKLCDSVEEAKEWIAKQP